MKKYILDMFLILVIIGLAIVLVVTVKDKNSSKDFPNPQKYKYILETTSTLDENKEENIKCQQIIVLDDKEVCVAIIRQNTYKDERIYKEDKSKYDVDKEIVIFDDEHYIVTEISKSEKYEENDSLEQWIDVVNSQVDANNEYLNTIYKVY